MSDKQTEAQKEQARIVAEQEVAQSVPPYPSQAQIDAARKGLGDVTQAASEPVSEAATPGTAPDIEKVVEAGKAPGGYKTRATKAD